MANRQLLPGALQIKSNSFDKFNEFIDSFKFVALLTPTKSTNEFELVSVLDVLVFALVPVFVFVSTFWCCTAHCALEPLPGAEWVTVWGPIMQFGRLQCRND